MIRIICIRDLKMKLFAKGLGIPSEKERRKMMMKKKKK